MTDNTAQAKKKFDGQRSSVCDASRKWHRYTAAHAKEAQWKTIRNAQAILRESRGRTLRSTSRMQQIRGSRVIERSNLDYAKRRVSTARWWKTARALMSIRSAN